MIKLGLKRCPSTDDGTFGVLHTSGKPLFVTAEEAWRENDNNVSCIPAGLYKIKKVLTNGHGVTWQVQNVMGRDGILFHSGNTEIDTEGCILLGKEFGEVTARDEQSGNIEVQPGVLRSREAHMDFMEFMSPHTEALLEVSW